MALDDDIAEYLKAFCMGEQAAVIDRTLENVFHVRGPDLRRSVNRLFYSGCCSETEEELQRTVRQFRSRIKKIDHAERGLASKYGMILNRFLHRGQRGTACDGAGVRAAFIQIQAHAMLGSAALLPQLCNTVS